MLLYGALCAFKLLPQCFLRKARVLMSLPSMKSDKSLKLLAGFNSSALVGLIKTGFPASFHDLKSAWVFLSML